MQLRTANLAILPPIAVAQLQANSALGGVRIWIIAVIENHHLDIAARLT